MKDTGTPTLSAWAGGAERIRRVVEHFYGAAIHDALLGPLFGALGPEHVEHVARFIDEVLGGPPTYGEKHGGHAEMVRRHVGKRISDAQRKRWLELWLASADACGLPDDAEFRSALVGYLEWGSRLAMTNSKLDHAPAVASEMPKWGWGEVKGPYVPPSGDEGKAT